MRWVLILAMSAGALHASDLGLRVQTRGGQSEFHVGEVIRLELFFTSSGSGRYQLSTTPYHPNALRGNPEGIEIEPKQGWDDSLDHYFRAGDFYYQGGFQAFPRDLSADAQVVPLELNEWVRFNEPGQYRIRILSRRVIDSEVMSNELVLTIVPATREWLQEALERAKAGLSGPARGEASKVLRYLGTPEAAGLMAANYLRPDLRRDFELGLVATPARGAALDAMKALLGDPDFPVDGDFLLTLSMLAMPPEVMENVVDIRKEHEDRLRQELRLVLESKRGEAAAVSKRTLLESK